MDKPFALVDAALVTEHHRLMAALLANLVATGADVALIADTLAACLRRAPIAHEQRQALLRVAEQVRRLDGAVEVVH